jgi:hypothetical protein
MTDRYRLSRPVFLAIWLGLVVAFVIVIVTGAPIMLLALIGPWQTSSCSRSCRDANGAERNRQAGVTGSCA